VHIMTSDQDSLSLHGVQRHLGGCGSTKPIKQDTPQACSTCCKQTLQILKPKTPTDVQDAIVAWLV
jgi:hypothetical protein